MTSLQIKINRIGDPASFPELKGKVAFEVTPSYVVVLESGTGDGNTSVYFNCRMKSAVESYVGFQMTANMLRSLVAAIDGAEAHWKETDGRN